MGTMQRISTGAAVVDWMIPVLTGFLANEIVKWSAFYTDETWQLLLLAGLSYVLCCVVRRCAETLALLNDGIIDSYEQIGVYVLQFAEWLLFYLIPMYLFTLIGDYIGNYSPLPWWPEACALAAVLLLLLVAVLPRRLTGAADAASRAYADLASHAPLASATSGAGAGGAQRKRIDKQNSSL